MILGCGSRRPHFTRANTIARLLNFGHRKVRLRQKRLDYEIRHGDYNALRSPTHLKASCSCSSRRASLTERDFACHRETLLVAVAAAGNIGRLLSFSLVMSIAVLTQ